MKKLMIAAAIVCAAAFSYGAQVYWGVSSVVDGDTPGAFDPTAAANVRAADLTGYTAYLIIASDWNSADLAGSLEKKVSSQVLGGIYESPAIAAWTVETDAYSVNKGTAGTKESYYIILSDGENYVQSKLFAGVDVLSDGATTQDPVKAVFASTGFANGSYLSAADVQSVPEPTSGLLLLLGVAGLALRRRRV